MTGIAARIGQLVIPNDLLTRSHITAAFQKCLDQAGFDSSQIFQPIMIRHPEDKYTFGWHIDVGGVPHYIVLWANILATLVRDKVTKEEMHFNPNDVIVINNWTAEHCAPAESVPGRFVARIAYI